MAGPLRALCGTSASLERLPALPTAALCPSSVRLALESRRRRLAPGMCFKVLGAFPEGAMEVGGARGVCCRRFSVLVRIFGERSANLDVRFYMRGPTASRSKWVHLRLGFCVCG